MKAGGLAENVNLKLSQNPNYLPCTAHFQRKNLPSSVGWAAGSKTSLNWAVWKCRRAGISTDTPAVWAGTWNSAILQVRYVFKRSPLKWEKNWVCYLSLPSLKSLISGFSKWITTFNNDINLSITWDTNLSSLKEKWDILEIFTAVKWTGPFLALFW